MRFGILTLKHPAMVGQLMGKEFKPMTSRIVSSFAWVLTALVTAAIAMGQQPARGTLKICRNVPVPDGYVIVAFVTTPLCPNGAYVIKKEPSGAIRKEAASVPGVQANARQAQPQTTSRPRRVGSAAQ